MRILDFLFPKYCVSCKKLGSFLCDGCFTSLSFHPFDTCIVCNRPSLSHLTHTQCHNSTSIDGVFSALSYKGSVKKLLYQFKYKPYVSSLSDLLIELFYEALIQKESFMHILSSSQNPHFCPIPLHPKRLQKRGYNHSFLLAKGLSQKFSLPLSSLLLRTKPTLPQFGLSKENRTKNLSHAFSLIPHPPPTSPTIFLVDDILTTGSTFLEAAKTLKQNGFPWVYGLALAHD